MPESSGPDRPGQFALLFAWAGGVAFVVSLLTFVFSYEFLYVAAPAGSALALRAGVDLLLFTVFGLHHSLFARTNVKTIVARAAAPWLERSLYTWVSSLLFIIVCLAWLLLPGTSYALSGVPRDTAYAIQIGGILLTARASSAIDVLDLAGVRQVLNARNAFPARHVPLETGGVYQLVRHPLYLGWSLFVFAAPTMTATRLLFAIASTGYLCLAIPFEERSLVAVFGDEYRAYQRRTRWRIVPGVW